MPEIDFTKTEVCILIIIVVCLIAVVLGRIVYYLRDVISDIEFTRLGFTLRVDNSQINTEMFEEINRIDSEDASSMRKATTSITLFDPEKYNTSEKVLLALLINREANMPLVYAVYENHHTRAIAVENGVEKYIADKVYDVSASLRVWKKRFPEITDALIEEYVYRWIKKIAVPFLRNACNEKINYYKSLLERKDIRKPLKEKVTALLRKNIYYTKCIDELYQRSSFQNTALRLPNVTQ